MVNIELITSIPVHNELGEGVIWDAETQSVWWTDIQQSKLFRLQWADQQLDSWSTPERLACFALVEGKNYLVAGFASGFAYYEPTSGKVEWLQKIEIDSHNTRLNDGRADRQGNFWAGTMREQEGDTLGALYCLDKQLKCNKKFGNLEITNSLCWSPDSDKLYHADTPTRRIDCYDYDTSNQQLSNKTTFAETPDGYFPDGSTIDADGYLWNAQWGGSQVARYAPNGELVQAIETPISQPSCVAFGGPDMNLLFVTSATQDMTSNSLANEPDAGNLFIYQTGTTGIADPRFQPEVTASTL